MISYKESAILSFMLKPKFSKAENSIHSKQLESL